MSAHSKVRESTAEAQTIQKPSQTSKKTEILKAQSNFKRKTSCPKAKLAIGLVSFTVGFWAANLALFHWIEHTGLHYLWGDYAKYACAYGSFSAMIFGALLVNDYLTYRSALKERNGKAESHSLNRIEKVEPRKRIMNRACKNLKKTIIAIPLILTLALCPTVFSVVSYTATVNIIVKPASTYYLHRTYVPASPLGRLMNNFQPPPSQAEALRRLARGETIYFYSPTLAEGSIESGTWVLYIWASTVSSGRVSRLTVGLHIVSSDGTVEKALIGSISNVIIDYGYSERTISITGSNANIASTDRIRLTLYAQSGFQNDFRGLNFYYDGYGTYQTLGHETRLKTP